MSATLKNAIRAVNRTALMLGSISTLAISSAALAQEEGALMEEIEVTGIRGSLKQAMDTKRFSNAVVDAVSAEDIGKFPDSDIGESLGRIPGVSVGRSFGQGASVSIRGASASLTNTLLNGHTVASTGWFDQTPVDRSFNYSLMPSEMVGDIEVYKSSQADLPEGGVGGTVIVNTRKPLDMDANSVHISAKGDYGTASEEWDPELSGLYSWKNDSESFGMLIAGSWSETDYLRSGVESDLAWGAAIVPSAFQQEREQTAVNVALQFAPTDALTFGLNYMLLDLEANNANTSMYIFPGAANTTSVNDGGFSTSHNVTDGSTAAGFFQTWVRQSAMDSETIDFTVDFEGEGFTIDARIGNTQSDGGTTLTANYATPRADFGAQDGGANFVGSYDATGKEYKANIANKSYGQESFDSNEINQGAWSLKGGPNSDEEFFAQANFELETDLGAITSIKTGFTYADHEVERAQYLYNTDVDTPILDANAYYSGQVDAGNGFSLPEPKAGSMLSLAKSRKAPAVEDRAGFGTVEEENLGLYVMANFEGEGFRGNFGFRYIETDAESQYYALDSTGAYALTKSTDKANYSDVLPSANLAFDLSDDVILRMSASQVISRANYADMFSASSTDGLNNGTPNNETLNTGNIGLAPFKATQADLGIEWYYGDGSMVSATYFIKDISSFVTTELTPDQSIGIIDDDTQDFIDNGGTNGCMSGDCWVVSQKVAGSGGEIEGLELQWQHAFDNGFGVATNYTYVDGAAPRENYADMLAVFSDSSQHNANLVGYWENDTFSSRVAYNWRSEYMTREGNLYYGNRMNDAYGSLDLSLGWNVTDSVTVSLEASNILEEDQIQTGEAPATATDVKAGLRSGYPAWSYDGEARYKLGVALSF